jgi:uncharacterized protein with HEPN domain
MRSTRDYLQDLMSEIEVVERFTHDGKEAFLVDERTQYAVMMVYARIGEIVKHIPNDILIHQSQIEWSNIKGFRDILLHRYFDVSIHRVWEAIEKLPALRIAVQTLLADMPSDDEMTE